MLCPFADSGWSAGTIRYISVLLGQEDKLSSFVCSLVGHFLTISSWIPVRITAGMTGGVVRATCGVVHVTSTSFSIQGQGGGRCVGMGSGNHRNESLLPDW